MSESPRELEAELFRRTHAALVELQACLEVLNDKQPALVALHLTPSAATALRAAAVLGVYECMPPWEYDRLAGVPLVVERERH